MIKELRRHQFRVVATIMTVSLLVVGQYLYTQVLPYHLSPQGEFSSADNTGEYDSRQQQGEFLGTQVSSVLVETEKSSQVLGLADEIGTGIEAEKHIEVDLTNQKLYAVQDGERLAEFYVSTGKWGKTPTGEFTIWTKYRYTGMSGGNQALGTYYNLPNVPFTMYFFNSEIPKSRGYGIHGAYWHSNFGEVMSHGCINMRTRDVEKLYYWAGPDTGGKSTINATEDNPGTKIIIYGEAPQN